jgi:hypothetical protein
MKQKSWASAAALSLVVRCERRLNACQGLAFDEER